MRRQRDSADISQARERGNSEHGSDRLNRLEELIGNIMRDLTREREEQAQLPLPQTLLLVWVVVRVSSVNS